MSAPVVAAFSEIIHSPVRLRICGLLRRIAELEFAVVRDTLQLSDANLSKNLKTLAVAGLITVRKERSQARADSRQLTWVSLTPQGKSALEAHLAALAQIVDEER
ncbi:transcriptional regulator [Microbacterium sp. CPCC 204701]|uniref:transcriptional regulator n=1 Tax=Microbacterium sp. CPCC 204701 TaxID=2493084 RepID=UPI000FD946E6|nr:transcriptional regulator [Microbacterium sp. CPCC 204701]